MIEARKVSELFRRSDNSCKLSNYINGGSQTYCTTGDCRYCNIPLYHTFVDVAAAMAEVE